MRCGEFEEEEKALNLAAIIEDKPIMGNNIDGFQEGGLTCLKVALMLLGRMVPSEESSEERNIGMNY